MAWTSNLKTKNSEIQWHTNEIPMILIREENAHTWFGHIPRRRGILAHDEAQGKGTKKKRRNENRLDVEHRKMDRSE